MNKNNHTTPSQNLISVHGARVNNLKDISLHIPRGQFVVITGLSGSGKSSLAFDTLYAEGRRRYVESLSSYARQFLGKLRKPEADFIKGLPPAIAIEQKVNTRNPRSTVGTSTEIYDYLRMLFGRIGRTFSPISGTEVTRHTVAHVEAAVAALPPGTRIAVAAPITLPHDRTLSQQLQVYLKEGYTRLVSPSGQFIPIDHATQNPALTPTSHLLLIDRLAAASAGDELSRLADSTETAFFEGKGSCTLLIWQPSGVETLQFSNRFEADGITFLEPSEQMFNFNNPLGACTTCEGFGKVLGIDENLVIPDKSLTLYDGAVAPWRSEAMAKWKRQFITQAATTGFPIHTPYSSLTPAQRQLLWHGPGSASINAFFEWLESQRHQIQYRVMMARYKGRTVCPTCHGSRLRPEAAHVKVGGASITQLVEMPVTNLAQWFKNLSLPERDTKIASRLLTEISSRLQFLLDVGLGYLTLNRLSNSLSGGESQRINLATSLGSSLMGSLYILDEPSIGLHPRDTARLISVLKKLKALGNTVVVVEHDEEIMRAADTIIDIGPDAGRLGGEIVYQGPIPSDAAQAATLAPRSHTLRYLAGAEKIPVPSSRRHSSSHIEVLGASHHNLKNINVRFPLGIMNVVTGVSGSGKSTLVRDILFRALLRHLGLPGDAPGSMKGLCGDLHRISAVEFVDQNPIGKSTRSNPATYLKAYDEIRTLFADQQQSRQMGFTPAHFSFNTEGGRCEECKGEGSITVEMQFMADIVVPCETCHGKRFKRDILQVLYREKNIFDILQMTVAQAIEFFSQAPGATERRIVRRLQPLLDVGLGYIKLGQSSSTLSGGENQRVKLAWFLAQEKPAPTLFIFDEPTTGLHFHDINILLGAFNRLIAQGHTLVIIEHNPEIIKSADNIIDIGPEGGNQGGNLVATGTPEQIVAQAKGHTAQFLKHYLN